MPRGVKKENLPTKICITCGRPFTWRKKWERVWDEVTTCSKSCNRKRRESNRNQNVESNIQESDGEDSRVFFERTKNTILESGNDQEATPDEIQVEEPTIDAIADETYLNLSVSQPDSSELNQLLENLNEEESNHSEENDDLPDDPKERSKIIRKREKKARKAARRAQRSDPTAGQKPCDMCDKSVNLLIRCMYEPHQLDWKMVCGKCWNVASGGVVDGDANHPHYRYGGLWKNRRAPN
jgi:hypothetical protein